MLDRLQKLQNRCIQLNVKTSCKNLKNLDINDMITLENYKFGFKLVNNILPVNIVRCAMSDHDGKSLAKTHRYCTRNRNLPNVLKSKKTAYLHP